MNWMIVRVAMLLAISVVSVVPGQAQTRPAVVRSVDEPARVPYFHSIAPTCGFTNQCISTFPIVPAGKRLRVTAISGFFRNTNVTGFVAFQKNNAQKPLNAFPVSPFNGAYYGALISFNQVVDVFFDAGETPVLEFGIPAGVGGIAVDPTNRLTVSGYLVDLSL